MLFLCFLAGFRSLLCSLFVLFSDVVHFRSSAVLSFPSGFLLRLSFASVHFLLFSLYLLCCATLSLLFSLLCFLSCPLQLLLLLSSAFFPYLDWCMSLVPVSLTFL
eukprot:GILK01012615.1.p1 GENE.GILK01012615.1~~GILK01012615.1.p1  ORF type:complete len:106 (+),score=7.83 GILK01012615.1:157-474(+)